MKMRAEAAREWMIRCSAMTAPAEGGSMRGAIAPGERLLVRAMELPAVETGDIVAFRRGGRVRVHRVAAIRNGRWWTQGDGNWRRDAEPLDMEEFIGRVDEVVGPAGTRTVAGGAQGRRQAIGRHAAAFLRWGFLSLLAPLYRLAGRSRLAARFWRPDILTVRFVAADGRRTKYIHRGQTVACWHDVSRGWTCRRPYDLILFPPLS